MIEATIKAVQEAEAKADELIAEAKLLAARAEGEKILADGEAESGKEIKSLKETAAGKADAAVSALIGELIG